MNLPASIDAALDSFLEEQRIAVSKADPAGLPAIDEIRRVVSAGGKRLRPLFCYWGYRAAGGKDSGTIVRAAGSLELLHTFAIIHDDFMDRSPLRRGGPASHVAFGDGHWGASAAILAGDLAFVLADRMLCDAGFGYEPLLEALAWFNQMRLEVIVGQFADIAASRDGADELAARRIAALKSGSYTVEKPLVIGAALAGAPTPLIEALSAFGRPLGEAFQLRDDVLGAFGEPSLTGKDAEADLREGKATVLIAKARARANEDQRVFLDDKLGNATLTVSDVQRLRDVLRDTGALEETNELISSLHATALAALDAARLSAEVRSALLDLAGLAVDRSH